jgi:hypothetical protein
LTVARVVPAGNEIVQVAALTAAGVAAAKQEATSKQSPVLGLPFAEVEPSPGAPPSDGAVTVGTAEGGTVLLEHVPRTQVCPPGHVEPTPPSASGCADPSQR